MKTKLITFYCWIDDEIRVSETEPDNFETLPYAKIEHAPTADIAFSAYNASLTLMKIRQGE